MPKFEINNLTKSRIDKKFLEKIGKKVFRVLPRACQKVPEVSIVIVGDAKIRNLNKRYRKKNKVTDVLAFDYGEIFICLPQARRQAKKLGHSLKKELGILLIHGLLHLAGYDDKTKKGYNKMVNKQKELWRKATS